MSQLPEAANRQYDRFKFRSSLSIDESNSFIYLSGSFLATFVLRCEISAGVLVMPTFLPRRFLATFFDAVLPYCRLFDLFLLIFAMIVPHWMFSVDQSGNPQITAAFLRKLDIALSIIALIVCEIMTPRFSGSTTTKTFRRFQSTAC